MEEDEGSPSKVDSEEEGVLPIDSHRPKHAVALAPTYSLDSSGTQLEEQGLEVCPNLAKEVDTPRSEVEVDSRIVPLLHSELRLVARSCEQVVSRCHRRRNHLVCGRHRREFRTRIGSEAEQVSFVVVAPRRDLRESRERER